MRAWVKIFPLVGQLLFFGLFSCLFSCQTVPAPVDDYSLARAAIDCLIQLQAAGGGDGLVGRQLQPLLVRAGYDDVRVGPRTVYADRTRPELVQGFTRNTFIAMIESVRDDALSAGLATAADWDQGIADLHLAAGEFGTFHYTFFKGLAVNPPLGRGPTVS